MHKQLLKHGKQEVKVSKKLCRTAFACETDAEQDLSTFAYGLRPRSHIITLSAPRHASSNDKFPPLSLDARFVATIRCVIAIALVFILTLDPPTRARFSEVIDLLLGLYATYSMVLYLVARWWRPILPGVLEPWIHVSWARGLMALSRERTLKGRLAFRKDITHLSNPRLRGDRTTGLFMEHLHAFHDADACILVMSDRGVPRHHLRCVNGRDPKRGEHPAPLPEELARCNGHFTLQIAHDGAAPVPLNPRSLTERVSALGGQRARGAGRQRIHS